MKTLRLASVAILLLPALLPGSAPAQLSTTLDTGTFIVSHRGRQIATEEFSYDQIADSVLVSASAKFKVPRAGAESTSVTKDMALVVTAMDFGMRHYLSQQTWEGHTIKNAIEGISDTLFTVVRELDKTGNAERMVLPPGRIFVMDPQLFTLFDVMCRNLSRQTFDQRPLTVLTLGPVPRVSEATARSVGSDTLRWGGRRVVARRIAIVDSTARFDLWIAPEGHMLRLENAPSGLRVDRQPPPALAPKKRR